MDHNGFQWRTEHFPAIIKTQLDVLRDVYANFFLVLGNKKWDQNSIFGLWRYRKRELESD